MFAEFRRRYPTTKAFAAAPESELETLCKPLGLAWRVPLLHSLAQRVSELDDELPEDTGFLETLPGVGPYAAAATVSLHGSSRAVLIDANIVRVLCRLTGAEYDGETRRKRWIIDLADQLTPPRAFRDYGYAMLDLGMLICRPQTPRCHECPLADLCKVGSEILGSSADG